MVGRAWRSGEVMLTREFRLFDLTWLAAFPLALEPGDPCEPAPWRRLPGLDLDRPAPAAGASRP